MPTLQNKETISATNLFVFNPEHDLALAVGCGPYTPPAKVVRLRKEFSLLPALYAANSDFIIIPDKIPVTELETLRFFDIALKKNLKIISFEDIQNHLDDFSKIFPWGWDHAIYNDLSSYGVPPLMLPPPAQINKIRELSHRRTSIKFRERISQLLGVTYKNPSLELFSIEETELFLNQYPLSYYKAPWSSSGYGIVVSDHISRKGLLEWSHGIIRKQGSLIAEPAWNRIFDFASEWWIKNKVPEFIGYSVFMTSSRGKYHGNMEGSQKMLLDEIKKYAPGFDSRIIEAQKIVLAELIAPYYSGPLGIDMFVDSNGDINHCVEINLRFTMGFVNLNPEKYFKNET